MTTKIVYIYDENGVFLHPYECQESPLEPGEYIVPEQSLAVAPPVTAVNECAVAQAGAWVIKPSSISPSTNTPVPLTPEQVISNVRLERDARINAVTWKYERHARETRLGLAPTDDIAVLDKYVQDLADVPKQSGFPDAVVWPVL